MPTLQSFAVLGCCAAFGVACASSDTSRTSASTSSAVTSPPQRSAAPTLPSLKVGDAAPAFDLQGSDGKRHTLAEHAGRQAIVVAWFPKAFTGG